MAIAKHRRNELMEISRERLQRKDTLPDKECEFCTCSQSCIAIVGSLKKPPFSSEDQKSNHKKNKHKYQYISRRFDSSGDVWKKKLLQHFNIHKEKIVNTMRTKPHMGLKFRYRSHIDPENGMYFKHPESGAHLYSIGKKKSYDKPATGLKFQYKTGRSSCRRKNITDRYEERKSGSRFKYRSRSHNMSPIRTQFNSPKEIAKVNYYQNSRDIYDALKCIMSARDSTNNRKEPRRRYSHHLDEYNGECADVKKVRTNTEARKYKNFDSDAKVDADNAKNHECSTLERKSDRELYNRGRDNSSRNRQIRSCVDNSESPQRPNNIDKGGYACKTEADKFYRKRSSSQKIKIKIKADEAEFKNIKKNASCTKHISRKCDRTTSPSTKQTLLCPQCKSEESAKNESSPRCIPKINPKKCHDRPKVKNVCEKQSYKSCQTQTLPDPCEQENDTQYKEELNEQRLSIRGLCSYIMNPFGSFINSNNSLQKTACKDSCDSNRTTNFIYDGAGTPQNNQGCYCARLNTTLSKCHCRASNKPAYDKPITQNSGVKDKCKNKDVSERESNREPKQNCQIPDEKAILENIFGQINCLRHELKKIKHEIRKERNTTDVGSLDKEHEHVRKECQKLQKYCEEEREKCQMMFEQMSQEKGGAGFNRNDQEFNEKISAALERIRKKEALVVEKFNSFSKFTSDQRDVIKDYYKSISSCADKFFESKQKNIENKEQKLSQRYEFFITFMNEQMNKISEIIEQFKDMVDYENHCERQNSMETRSHHPTKPLSCEDVYRVDPLQRSRVPIKTDWSKILNHSSSYENTVGNFDNRNQRNTFYRKPNVMLSSSIELDNFKREQRQQCSFRNSEGKYDQSASKHYQDVICNYTSINKSKKRIMLCDTMHASLEEKKYKK